LPKWSKDITQGIPQVTGRSALPS